MNNKRELWFWFAVLASVIVAASAFYTVYLITKSGFISDEEAETVDHYQIKLEQYLGISGSNYEERILYTDDLFDGDRKQIITYIQNGRFEDISATANRLLATYRFDDDKLSTLIGLEDAYLFGEDSEASTEQKVSMVSKICDPILYVIFFLKLDYNQQQLLIQHEDVKQIPAFEYHSYSYEYVEKTTGDPIAAIVKGKPYYKVKLGYYNREYYVYLMKQESCQIFFVDNYGAFVE